MSNAHPHKTQEMRELQVLSDRSDAYHAHSSHPSDCPTFEEHCNGRCPCENRREEDIVLDVAGAAEHYAVSETTIRAWLKNGRLDTAGCSYHYRRGRILVRIAR